MSKKVTLYKIVEEQILVHDMADFLEYHSVPFDPGCRVVDAAEHYEPLSVERIELPIRKHAFAEHRRGREPLITNYYIAVDRKTETVLGIEVQENQRLRDHAEQMQSESVIDLCHMKNMTHHMDLVMRARWYRRLIWAFTGEIN